MAWVEERPMTDIRVDPTGVVRFCGRRYACALGRGGVIDEKREGDGATPVGRFRLRRLLYRPDRLGPPSSGLPVAALRPDDGWCDDAADPAYNRPVRLPYPASAESLWRADRLYDLVVALGFNDEPVRPGRGSAIFLHVAGPDLGPTEGCVAVALDDLLEVLAAADLQTQLWVEAPGAPAQ